MIPEYFAVVGAIIASLGGMYYLYETIKGTAKPNRITWLLWAIFPMVTFIAQRAQGVEALAWVSFASGLTPMLVIVASFFNKNAFWKTQNIDYVCMVAGLLGILLWVVTKDANTAIAFAIFADLAAAFPTVLKAYKHPESESWIAFTVSTFGFIIGMFAIQQWTFENYAFITYLTLINGLIAVLAVRKPSKRPLMIELE